MNEPVLVPLTLERLQSFLGERIRAKRVEGFAVELNGATVGVFGLVREWWWLRMFADVDAGFNRSRVALTACRAARRLLDSADRTVYAAIDPKVSRAANLLLWLGFEPLVLGFFRYRRR